MKNSSLLIILLVISVIGNIYWFSQNNSVNSKLIRNEVSNLKMFTQNAVVAINGKDPLLLRQTYSNFQSKPPFTNQESTDSTTERVINKYEEIFRIALKEDEQQDSLLKSKLEESFEILVPLSETEDLNLEEVKTAMSKINNVLADISPRD